MVFVFRAILIAAIVFTGVMSVQAQGVTPELALSFKPIQSLVEYDIPAKEEIPQCKIEVIKGPGGSGWVVYAPNGLTLRRFMDTNNDNTVDQWSYYRTGIEVYRDNDTNFNKKVDQSRWLNTGGTRWGVDTNEDGKIDSWKQISVEEVAELVFHAYVQRDAALMETLMINEADLKALGFQTAIAEQIRESVANVSGQMQKELAGKGPIGSDTKWIRFDAASPGVIPADAGKARSDLSVYENARALIENKGSVDLLQIGELVRVGDAWKLTQLPRAVGRDSGPIEFGGILLQPESQASPGEMVAPVASSEESRKLLDQLQKLDENSPSLAAGADALGRYNKQRADLLQQLVAIAKTEEEREVWIKQLVDGIAAAIQTGAYPDGLPRLEQMEASVRKDDPKSELYAYVMYRRMSAEYSRKAMTTPSEKQGEVQSWWVESLESFVKNFPKSPEAPEAAFQIASSLEISGKTEEAKKWYSSIARTYSSTLYAQKAQGCLRRMDIEGKVLELKGKTLDGRSLDLSAYRGKVVLVAYWATWCEPCLAELPQLQALSQQYRAQGFEIVGVNLDLSDNDLDKFVRDRKMIWPHIREDGGLDSPPAVELGILMPPAMFLLDKQGKVISSHATIEVLKDQIPKYLK
ncbi:MAG TPA: redoxin domain-containing protein [Planctomycetaceae bacterium]|nr:redoxin domain-containing protein [Planctomycetaceae bacterium]